jgi:hypothetical protein
VQELAPAQRTCRSHTVADLNVVNAACRACHLLECGRFQAHRPRLRPRCRPRQEDCAVLFPMHVFGPARSGTEASIPSSSRRPFSHRFQGLLMVKCFPGISRAFEVAQRQQPCSETLCRSRCAVCARFASHLICVGGVVGGPHKLVLIAEIPFIAWVCEFTAGKYGTEVVSCPCSRARSKNELLFSQRWWPSSSSSTTGSSCRCCICNKVCVVLLCACFDFQLVQVLSRAKFGSSNWIARFHS